MAAHIALDPDELDRASALLEEAHTAYKNQALWLITPKVILMDPGVWAGVEMCLTHASASLGGHAVRSWSKGNELKTRAAIARDPRLAGMPPWLIELLIHSHAVDVLDLRGHDPIRDGKIQYMELLRAIPLVDEAMSVVDEVDDFMTTGVEMIDAGMDQYEKDADRDDLTPEQRWERALIIAMIPMLRKEIIDAGKDGGKKLGGKIGRAVGRRLGSAAGARAGAWVGGIVGTAAGPAGTVGGAGAGAVAGAAIGGDLGGQLGEWLGKKIGGRIGERSGEWLADEAETYLRNLIETDPRFGGSRGASGGGGGGW